MTPSKAKSREKKKTPRGGAASPSVAERLEQLEDLVELILRASLRGRLLPSERKVIKAHVEARNALRRQKQKAQRKTEGPRCPACRLLIPDEKAERCPHCSVLLAVAAKSRKRTQKKSPARSPKKARR